MYFPLGTWALLLLPNRVFAAPGAPLLFWFEAEYFSCAPSKNTGSAALQTVSHRLRTDRLACFAQCFGRFFLGELLILCTLRLQGGLAFLFGLLRLQRSLAARLCLGSLMSLAFLGFLDRRPLGRLPVSETP